MSDPTYTGGPSRGLGDPDDYGYPGEPDFHGVYVNPKEEELHWSVRAKLGYKPATHPEYELGDKMADGSDDQGWDNEGDEDVER